MAEVYDVFLFPLVQLWCWFQASAYFGAVLSVSTDKEVVLTPKIKVSRVEALVRWASSSAAFQITQNLEFQS